ncbi:ATP-dependent DNA helicase RecG [Reinekea blandensis]|uniref:ATP-dependent DNA helicase RecG n=1 Tax=Reinekea blandensis MED297 TaxID=314283 RepID=A4BIV8_9GAMM|nr:ATP-dependent DNA helicase RecG [Reinekea blandensis]EAR07975.1 ATP-dependent DNA helicase RecG [Reinekea sp. MED297] [Reinekea blandensis MED297]
MQNALTLSAPISRLKGAGPKLADKLAQLELTSIGDLLFHLPYKYQDRTRITPIGSLRLGMAVVIEGDIRGTQVAFGRRRSLICRIQDGSGLLTIRLFHFTKAQQHVLKNGAAIRCYGEVRMGPTGLEMIHPEYQVREQGEFEALDQRLTPLYPTTEGIHQIRLRNLIEQALDVLNAQGGLPEWLPPDWLTPWQLPSLTDALRTLHRPDPNTDTQTLLDGEHPAQQRLAFEELLAHHLSLQALRQATQATGAQPIAKSKRLVPALRDQLPFSLTGAQQRVCGEIAQDLAHPFPMLRLVQGDVGAGKTLVALIAALQAIESGLQVALMAPTELLAEQHFLNMQAWCEPLGVSIGLLLGKTSRKDRNQLLDGLERGEVQLLVGTHALFQKGVDYHNLGLVIIDEQHRFGVQQRLALKEKANNGTPHQLTMTATPIPRTLAMTAFADMDISIIDELPPGRTPVTTTVISQDRREAVIRRVNAACDDGRQIYWVCTLIEESEELQAEAAEATANRLAEALPGRQIGLLHGKLKAADKSRLMAAFKAGELDILVATTVIEVGVDVPNASVMIIENPERLGLAQLHQLRGRVGRGTTESYCLLMFGQPLSEQGKQRLEVMRQTSDGFVIAEEDLKLRGPGEVLGTRQTGAVGFRVADMERDAHLLEHIPALADRLNREYPSHSPHIIARWLINADRYAQV